MLHLCLITGLPVLQIRKNRFLMHAYWNKTGFPVQDIRKTELCLKSLETGQPVKETGKPNFQLLVSGSFSANRFLKTGKPFSRHVSWVHIRATGFGFSASRFRLSSCCPLTGKPVIKIRQAGFVTPSKYSFSSSCIRKTGSSSL